LTLGSAPEFAARCLLSLTQAFGISGACSHAVIGVHMRPAPPPIIWLLCASAIIELTTPYSVRILPEVEQLAEHLSEGPFRLHGDLTPAVLRLSEIGPVVLPRMFEIMVGDRADHRVHAQSVIKRVSQQMYGFTPGKGWQRDEDAAQWLTMWKANGSLRWDDSYDERLRSVTLWRNWYALSAAGR
jgi:hypothetical protein